MKKTTRLLALLLALGMLLTLGACAKDTASNTSSNYKLVADGVLTIGMEMSYPPFESTSADGTPEGYDIDLGKALAEKLGLQVNFINTSFDGIFAGMGVNYDVVISGVTINESRKKEMLFSTPYISNYQAIVVRADSDAEYASLNDLTGKNVSLQKGTTSDDLFTELVSTGTIDAVVVANESVVTSLAMVSNGEVDACLCDSTVADVYVQKNPELKIAFKDESEPEEFGIAIPMDNAALQEAINNAMAELEAEGFFAESDAIWFG